MLSVGGHHDYDIGPDCAPPRTPTSHEAPSTPSTRFEDLSERGVFVVGTRTNAGDEQSRRQAIFAATFTDDLAERGCAWRHMREKEPA